MGTAIVILNWKNPRDTIDCINSIAKGIDFALCHLVICDNNSDDGSDAIILKMLQGLMHPSATWNFESSVGRFTKSSSSHEYQQQSEMPARVLINVDRNLGFAGGNNVGIRWAMEHTDADSFFIVNNDTVVEPNTVIEGSTYLETNPKHGIAGCVVRYFHDPDHLQAFGGASFSPFFGRAKHLCSGYRHDQLPPVLEIRDKIDYPLGAAMFVSRTFLQEVGLMHEKYFLYFEEIDWACRGRAKGFQVGIVAKATVFHKEGGTIGSSHIKAKRSKISEHYLNRGRLMFTRQWHPVYVPSVLSYNLFIAFRALLIGDLGRARIIFTATWLGLTDAL